MERNLILVSIVVPIFNNAANLPKCVSSLINQTLKDIEIILINDGSSDNSGEIIESIGKLDSRIVTINKENEGVSKTRNLGIKIARGEFLGFIDADDYISNEMYENLYYKANNNKAEMAMCKFNTITNSIYHKESWNFSYEELKPSEFILKNMVGVKNEAEFNINDPLMGSTCRCIYNRRILEKYNIYFNEEITYAEDLLFNIKYLTKISKVALVNEFLYNYVENKNSLSRSYRSDLFIMIMRLICEIKRCLEHYDFTVSKRRLSFAYFKYAIELIRNETKTLRPFSYSRYKRIKFIIKCEEFCQALCNINMRRLSIKNIFFYFMFRYKLLSLGNLFWVIRIFKIFARRIVYGESWYNNNNGSI